MAGANRLDRGAFQPSFWMAQGVACRVSLQSWCSARTPLCSCRQFLPCHAVPPGVRPRPRSPGPYAAGSKEDLGVVRTQPEEGMEGRGEAAVRVGPGAGMPGVANMPKGMCCRQLLAATRGKSVCRPAGVECGQPAQRSQPEPCCMRPSSA